MDSETDFFHDSDYNEFEPVFTASEIQAKKP